MFAPFGLDAREPKDSIHGQDSAGATTARYMHMSM
jgi:hypothetical protein